MTETSPGNGKPVVLLMAREILFCDAKVLTGSRDVLTKF